MKLFHAKPPVDFHGTNTRVSFRQFVDDDSSTLLELALDEPVSRFVPWAKWVMDNDSILRQIAEFNQSYTVGMRVRYAAVSGGRMIGYAGMWPDNKADFYEFGFAVLPKERGKGYGGDILKNLIEIAQKHLKATGMVAYVADENESSKMTVLKQNFVASNDFDDGDRRYELALKKPDV